MTATELLPCPFCKRPPATNPVAQDAWCAYHTQAMSYKAWNRRSQPEPQATEERWSDPAPPGPQAMSAECICPKCGIRHGASDISDPGF